MKHYFVDIACGVGIFIAIVIAYKLLQIIFKKKSLSDLIGFAKKELPYLSVFFVFFEIIVLLVVDLIFPITTTVNLLGLSCFIAIFSLVVNPKKIFERIRTRNFKNIQVKKIISISSFMVMLLLEVFAINSSSFSKDLPQREITTSEVTYKGLTNKQEDGSYILGSGSQIIFNVNEEDKLDTVFLEFDNINSYVYVDIDYKNMNNQWIRKSGRNNYGTNPLNETSLYLGVEDVPSDAVQLRLTFSIIGDYTMEGETLPDLVFHGVTINPNFPLRINLWRMLAVVGIVNAIIYASSISKLFSSKEEDPQKRIVSKQKKVILGGLVLMVGLFIVSFCFKDLFYIDYTKASLNIDKYNIYVQQFDAFLKGQLNLDLPVDERLLQLENVYDPAQRAGIHFFFDHAFYGGKYYCYYGVTPLLVFMTPIYILSGCHYLPSMIFILLTGEIFTIVMMLLVILQLSKLFLHRPNMAMLNFILIISIFTSLCLTLVTFKNGIFFEGIYKAPYAFGIGFMFAYIFFGLKAYELLKAKKELCDYSIRRMTPMLYLLIMAVCFVLMVASRPNMAVSFLFMAPLFIKMLLIKMKGIERVKTFVPCVATVLVGAIAICAYNYARYESITEFGQFYQFTVIDNTSISLQLKDIPAAFVHYFLQPYSISTTVPFIRFSWSSLGIESHSYINSTIGILMIPFFWALLFFPAIYRREDPKELKWFIGLMPISVFIIAWTTASYGGYCMRYLLDLFPIMSMMSAFVWLKMLDKQHDNQPSNSIAIPVISVIGLISIFIGIELLFNDFDGIIGRAAYGANFNYREIFHFYNF